MANQEIASSVVGCESLVDWLNKVCTFFADEGKLIFELDNYPDVPALDSLHCLVKSLVYGVQIRTVISIGYLDCAEFYLEKNVIYSPTQANAGGKGIVDEG